jgi:hypothetical protein
MIMIGVHSIFDLFDLEVLFMTHVNAQANHVEKHFVGQFQARKSGMGYNTLRGCPYSDPQYWGMRKYKLSLM